jgi:hypothetical protein
MANRITEADLKSGTDLVMKDGVPTDVETKLPQVTDKEFKEIQTKKETDVATVTMNDRDKDFAWHRQHTFDIISAQPREPILVPFNTGEDQNNRGNWYQFFGINGAYWMVRKGQIVYVPQRIAEMWRESQVKGVTETDMLLSNLGNKIDPVTGGKKNSAVLS